MDSERADTARRAANPPVGGAPRQLLSWLRCQLLAGFWPASEPAAGRPPSRSAQAIGAGCSPVTRNTIRFATDTAWSAKRS